MAQKRLDRYSGATERIRSAERARYHYRRHRDDLIQFLGGKCERCGITDFRVLQVDHVNGGGHREIVERLRGKYWKDYHDLIRADRSRYQLLCANCNWIKRHENNECYRGKL